MFDKEFLIDNSKELKENILRLIYYAKAGHPGGSLSCIDLLNYLYFYKLDLDDEKDKDRLILSKGHVTPALYSVFLKKSYILDNEITTFRKINSRLQGHPDRNKIKEIDANTGLLGQGLSIAVGIALAKKLKNSNKKSYVIIGDGEMHEGQIWEALMSCSHYNLDNIVVILDYNKLSSKGDVNKVMNLEPIKQRVESFGFEVFEIDGHNYEEIDKAFNKIDEIKGKPSFIIANTIKGKSVSFMENNPKWHSGALSDEEFEIAIRDIRGEDNSGN